VRYLSEAECSRVVNACKPAFRNLVRGALLTGCRYSEIAGLRTADFNADAGLVTIRESKAGKPSHVVLTDEGRRFFAALTAGKLANDPIFTRADGEVWGKSHQLRPMLDACRHAKIRPAVSFHVLRRTHGSMLAVRGVPMAVIAEQLGHAETRTPIWPRPMSPIRSARISRRSGLRAIPASYPCNASDNPTPLASYKTMPYMSSATCP
jgi:integrase